MIRDIYPRSEFLHLESRIQGQKGTGSLIRIRNKEFSYFNLKIVPKFSEIWSWMLISDPDFFPSRIQGPKKYWIPYTDPQHCKTGRKEKSGNKTTKLQEQLTMAC
jgi:hypothetical protein